MKLLAEALGVDVTVLRPLGAAGAGPVEMRMTVQGGRADLALLEVDKLVSTELASKIMTMIAAEKI